MITAVFIGKERLDLFEDENIVIKSSVAKIEDITKIFTDTSNDFTVPATDRNNIIFSHWYESNLINGFDARKKIPALIEISGINFKVGKIRLKKVYFEHNKAENYSLQFFGNLVELKDQLQDDKLTDLDLSALDFEFTPFNVRQKLSNVGDVSFSLLSKRRLFYDSSNSIVDNDKQTNIYYDNNNANTGIKTTDLTASLKQIKIIEAIEAKYTTLQFSRDFFNLYDFSNQFITLGGTNDKTIYQVPLTNIITADPTVNGNTMLATGFGTDIERQTISVRLRIDISAIYSDVSYKMYIKSDGLIVGEFSNITGGRDLNIQESAIEGGLNNVEFFIEVSEPFEFSSTMYRFSSSTSFLGYRYSSGTVAPTVNFNVSNRLPDIKIEDYLKGVFKMFKLVAIPEKDGTIYVDSLVNYYRKGTVYDLSKYIDYDSHKVSAGKILNEIKYNFEEPQTILNQQYLKNNGIGYGDLEHFIYEDPTAINKVLIEGTKLNFKLPFEQILYEKIVDISNDETDTNIQYGLLQDENLEFVTIKPHVHYIEKVSSSVKFIEDVSTAIDMRNINIPLHVLDVSLQTFSTTFGNEYNTYNGSLINNTLFSNYHSNYIELIFNVQKREYAFKAVDVPTEIVLKLGLNDVIEIKDNYYRIDSFETNTSDNNITFKLINDRIVDLVPLFPVSADNTIITVDSTLITADATSAAKINPIIPPV